jgi:tRNA-dihydrouridine synthase C
VVANGEIWTVNDARRCRQASGCNMLMLGRGAVTDPGLGLAIKVDMAGTAQASLSTLSPGIRWAELLPLLGAFWQVVCSRLDSRSRAGRLKQWLNFLRRRFPEAEAAYQVLKPVNDPALVGEWLAAALRAQKAAPPPELFMSQLAPLLVAA